MRVLRRLWITVPAVLLVVLLVWLYWTRGTMEQLAFLRKGSAEQSGLVDQRPFETAQALAAMAVSAEEQGYAQQAERLADHEVDQAFALALRRASMQTRVLTGEAAELSARTEALKAEIKDDQAHVDALTAAAKTSGVASADGDDLDVAKAQLGLDTDELADAQADLARASGDQRGEIQQELQAREARMKSFDDGKKETAVVAANRYQTLAGRISAWSSQRSRAKLIAQARMQAEADAGTLEKQHAGLEAGAGTPAGDMQGSARVAMLKKMAGHRVMMSILDDRTQGEQQLAAVYGRWEAQVWAQHRIVTHLIGESAAWVVFLVLVTVMLASAVRMAARRVTDARRARTLETILTLAVELLGLGAVLLVVFGVPEHLTTVLGLATAGLTVVFQDFIIAFVGWFVLMGRSGIRVGDWVEINSVGGEVAEIGLFRTTLLETGNWTSRGHPTGRRVSFTNSYAIRGQYFNYSTHGQWMWDEIKLNVPATTNPYELMGKMQTAVAEKTAKDTEEAEREWHAATRQNGLSVFKADPTVDLRPAASGVDVVVRFVTRANERFDVRNCLYETLLGLLKEAKPVEVGQG